jgi:CHAT domain-containing protein
LTVGPAPLSVAESSLFVAPGKAVHIHLEAPAAIEILSSAWQEIAISPDQDSPPAVFDLRPREVGAQSLVLDFYQAGNPLGTVRLSVDVLDQPLPEAQVRTRPHVLSLDARVPPPDRVLRIASHPESSSLVLTLIQGGGTSWSNPSSWQFRRDPALWAEELFKELNALIGHSDRPSRDVWIARGSPPAADVEKELKRIGQNLWQGLPEEFRSLYARERKLWKDSSLLILTDEPHLQWELLWPYGEVDDDEPWCLTLCLSRWLARRAVGDGNTGAPGILPLTALACVAPEDSHLPAARRERTFLQSLLRNRGVRDISPSVATLDAILDLLRVGPFDWFHVISHGNFSPRDPDRRSALCLEGRQALTPQHLVGAEIEGVLRRSHPAFVFNACHAGRMGWELTGLGGWADRLISCGAGLFLGPLWKVTDKAALQMARSFYERLLAGDTVAEAARKARREARKLGDPSWLAYSLYAHPNATVRLPGEARQVHTTLAASPPAS